ncbi:MAG: hypothetical protein ABR540_14305 [Acidimicrobiales bacterium]
MRGTRSAVIAVAVVVTALVLAAAGCGRSSSVEPPPPPASVVTPDHRAGIVSADGGTVTGVDGTSLTVPRNTVTKPTTVTITRLGDGYDIHLHGEYRGPLVVAVPTGAVEDGVEPFLLHQTAAGFVVEDAAQVGGFLVAEVTSLSLFKALKKCVRETSPNTPKRSAKKVLRCLVLEVGLPAIPKKIVKKLIDETNCGDITDIMGWITGDEACPAGETPEDIARLRRELPPRPPATSPPPTSPPATSPRPTSPPPTSPPTTAPPRRAPGAHYHVPIPDNAGGYDTKGSACGCGRQSFVAVYDTVTTATFVSYKGRGDAQIAISLLDANGTRLAERRFTLPQNQVTEFTADFNRHPVTRGATYFMELRAITDGMTIYLGNGDRYPQGRGYFDGKGPEDFAMTINGEDR